MSEATHHCPDGTLYRWTTRIDNPKACPRCKQYIDKSKPRLAAQAIAASVRPAPVRAARGK